MDKDKQLLIEFLQKILKRTKNRRIRRKLQKKINNLMWGQY